MRAFFCGAINTAMSDLYNEKKVHTRKPHQCLGCFRTIPKGFSAIHVRGICDDGFFRYYLCNTCNQITKEYREAIIDDEGNVDNYTLSECMSENECSTPLQLLNKLRKKGA